MTNPVPPVPAPTPTPTSRPAGSIQVGEIVNGKHVVATQNDDNVTVFYDDGTADTFAFTDQVPYQ